MCLLYVRILNVLQIEGALTLLKYYTITLIIVLK